MMAKKMQENNTLFHFNMGSKSLMILLCSVCFFVSTSVIAQENEEALKIVKQSQEYLSEASEYMAEDKFVAGEAEYRKAISLNEKENTGNYNLGNAYYRNNLSSESLERFKQAARTATEKPERHRAFHNLGNAMMNKKDYAGAVDAYKNALRNNPTDDETRYNFALAKDLLEKNPPEGGGDDEDKQDQNEDKKDEQDKKDQNKEGEDGDDKKDENKGDEEEDKKEGDKDDKGKPEEPKDNNEEKGDQPQQQQPVPGKLSPQEVKNLLESMNNEEKKVQDKINAQKQKGAKVKSEKDW